MSSFVTNPFNVPVRNVVSEQFAIPDDGTIVDLFSVANEQFKWIYLIPLIDPTQALTGGDQIRIAVMTGITPVASWPIIQTDNNKNAIVTPLFLPLTTVTGGSRRLVALFHGASAGNTHSIFRVAGLP